MAMFTKCGFQTVSLLTDLLMLSYGYNFGLGNPYCWIISSISVFISSSLSLLVKVNGNNIILFG